MAEPANVAVPAAPGDDSSFSVPPERFSRLMSITEAEWLRSLPAAVGAHVLSVTAGSAQITMLAEGEAGHRRSIEIGWSPADDLVLASIRLKRLRVTFDLKGLAPAARADFMRRFDLHMQRGGG